MQHKKKAVKVISEGFYEIISIDENKMYEQYSAQPLLTCFAYLLFYQTNQNERKAILYHSLSGLPKQMNEIINLIKKDFKSLDQVVIAISGSISNPTIKNLVEKAKEIINSSLTNIDNLNLTIIENAACYRVDSLGNHGVIILPNKNDSEPEINMELFNYLKNLQLELTTTRFTVKNWLNNEVTGTPKGVKALINHLEKLDNVKRDPKLLDLIYLNVFNEFQLIKSRKSDDRTDSTKNFYTRHILKLGEFNIPRLKSKSKS